MLRSKRLGPIIGVLFMMWADKATAEQQLSRERNSASPVSQGVDKSGQLTRSQALQLSTSQLARLLLPHEPRGRFVSHRLTEPTFEGGRLTAIEFFARPMPVGNDLCLRHVTFVSLEATVPLNDKNIREDIPARFSRARQKVQIAAAPRCKAEFGAFMAWVQPAGELTRAQEALRRLIALQRRARTDADSIQIKCRSETSENICAEPVAQVLSNLPTDRTFIIDPYNGGWNFSVMPNGPGPGLFWDVRLANDRDAVELVWRLVPPF